jgi:thiosulfate/3-mercaptopyruvate sulfurtransferase
MKNVFAAAGFSLCFTLAAAPHPEMLVSTDWLAQHLSETKLVILQVSANRNAYDAGHIPGARFIPLSDLVVTRNGVPNELPADAALEKALEAVGVTDDTRVILYGDSSVLPATRAFFTLDYLGHGGHTSLLDGGLEKWRAEGRTLTKDAPTVTIGHLTVHPKPETLVQFDQVSELAKRPPAAARTPVLLDVRPATDFSGEKGSHIPTSVNANWVNTQVSAQNQTLKPEAELRTMYEALGLKADVPVITYCNSGMQASQSYFTLKYLGYDVKLYDGSMSEWTLQGAPVIK